MFLMLVRQTSLFLFYDTKMSAGCFACNPKTVDSLCVACNTTEQTLNSLRQKQRFDSAPALGLGNTAR